MKFFKTKKIGFTLAEIIVAVSLIGVVAAVALPVLHRAGADRDKELYEKAMYTLQRATQRFMESPDYRRIVYANDDNKAAYLANLNNYTGLCIPINYADVNALREQNLCCYLAEQINTRGQVNCNGQGSFESPNFVTTDGIKFWWNATQQITPGNPLAINVANGGGIKKPGAGPTVGLEIEMSYRGKIYAEDDYEVGLLNNYQKVNK